MRGRLSGEAGFTLPEVVVSMALMPVVLFALYAMFDASVRVFGAGRDEAEAAQEARQALSRMEREIRAAYPQDKANGDGTLLAEFEKDRLVFGNDIGEDLGGNRRVIKPPTGAPEPKEGVSYTVSAAGAPLRNGDRMAASAKDIDGDGRALTFEYFDAQGGPVIGGEEEEEAEVALVGITLEVSAGRAGRRPVEHELHTTVALRNR